MVDFEALQSKALYSSHGKYISSIAPFHQIVKTLFFIFECLSAISQSPLGSFPCEQITKGAKLVYGLWYLVILQCLLLDHDGKTLIAWKLSRKKEQQNPRKLNKKKTKVRQLTPPVTACVIHVIFAYFFHVHHASYIAWAQLKQIIFVNMSKSKTRAAIESFHCKVVFNEFYHFVSIWIQADNLATSTTNKKYQRTLQFSGYPQSQKEFNLKINRKKIHLKVGIRIIQWAGVLCTVWWIRIGSHANAK